MKSRGATSIKSGSGSSTTTRRWAGASTTGSDSGFIYQTYGFSYILELEMLQEAGFHPLEVIQSATMNGALTLHERRATD